MMNNKNAFCDPVTGECAPADLPAFTAQKPLETGYEIIYVGDPMCSWCWGIANHLEKLRVHYPQYKFTIVLGGLRPGGGEAWDDRMKDFLKHHWEEVTKRSDQPFGYALFERDEFNYDTEPPCRAVVTARMMEVEDELAFFEAISRKFYVESEDPGQPEFYRSICNQFGIDFDAFVKQFQSEDAKYHTHQDFQLNRQWGVKGYPTVIFMANDQLYQINHGYTEFEQMSQVIEKVRAEEVANV